VISEITTCMAAAFSLKRFKSVWASMVLCLYLWGEECGGGRWVCQATVLLI
jgi:hypothetical protein